MPLSLIHKKSFNKAVGGLPPKPLGEPEVSDLKYAEFGINASLGLAYLRKKGYVGDPFNLDGGSDDTIVQLASMGVMNYGNFKVQGALISNEILLGTDIDGVNPTIGKGLDEDTYIEFGENNIKLYVDSNELVNFYSNYVNFSTDLKVYDKLVVTDAINESDGYGVFKNKVDGDLHFRTLKAGSNVSISEHSNGHLVISSTGGSGGSGGSGQISDPSDGAYGGVDGSIVGLESGLLIEDAFDKVDTFLAKLAPPAPGSINGEDLTLQGPTYSVYEESTSQLFSPVVETTFPKSTISQVLDPESGTVSAYLNNIENGVMQLSSSDDSGADLALEINSNYDPYSGQVGQAGFWSALNLSVDVGNLSSGLPTGEFLMKIVNSSGEETNELSGYVGGSASSPSASISNISTGQYITTSKDGVVSLAAGDQIQCDVGITSIIDAYYNAGTMLEISSNGGTTSSQFSISDSDSSNPAQNSTVYFTNKTISVSNNSYNNSFQLKARGRNYVNQYGSYSTSTSQNFYIDTTSQSSKRRDAGFGQFPVAGSASGEYNASSYENNNILNKEELQHINGKYKFPPQEDYSVYTPSSVDYSSILGGTHQDYRWALFNVGTITDKTTVNITISGANSYFSSDYNSLSKIISNFLMYARIDGGAKNSNGWVDGNTAYPGVGNPIDDGDAAFVVSDSNNTLRSITFGSAEKSGTVLVRVGIPQGDLKIFSDLTLTSST
jgi:hypothetical protein